MIYLLGQLMYPFPWLLAALTLGLYFGWYSCASDHSGR